jgi:hypothetical protein
MQLSTDDNLRHLTTESCISKSSNQCNMLAQTSSTYGAKMMRYDKLLTSLCAELNGLAATKFRSVKETLVAADFSVS